MNKREYVAALRELADYVEAREFPDEIAGGYYNNGRCDAFETPILRIYVSSKADFGKICAAMGSFEKQRDSYSTGARAVLPFGAVVGVVTSRDIVCKKIVVGTRTVAAKEEEIIPAEPAHEEEIVEWECPDSFIALGQETVE